MAQIFRYQWSKVLLFQKYSKYIIFEYFFHGNCLNLFCANDINLLNKNKDYFFKKYDKINQNINL